MKESSHETIKTQPVSLCGAIEAILFACDHPVSSKKLKELMGDHLSEDDILAAITQIETWYKQDHHGIHLQKVRQGFRFATKPAFSDILKKLHKKPSLMLSASACEVLAIVAYEQPISRMEINKIRSVDSSHLIRGLLDKKLIRITGRSDEAGRSVLYGTTNEFLEIFSLNSLKDLPPRHELEELSKEELGDTRDIRTLQGDRPDFDDELEELKALEKRIKETHSHTDFTKALHNQKTSQKENTSVDIIENFLKKKSSQCPDSTDPKEKTSILKKDDKEKETLV